MKNLTARVLCIKGLLIALVTVATMVINVPVAATSGYIHLGDSVILISSIFFGWEYGLIAGGVGSMLADILNGYAHWAPFTLVIKAVMGLIIGKLSNYDGAKGNFFSIRNMMAPFAGIVWMVFGYLACGTIIKGSFAVALTSVPSNVVQGIGGFVIYLVMGAALNKAKLYKVLSVK